MPLKELYMLILLLNMRRIFQLAILMMYMDLTSSGLHEKRLLKYLFDPSRPDAHNAMERPSKLDTAALNVSVKFFLNQVMDVDEKNQVLTTIIWMDLGWNDYHFNWNPEEYGNVTDLNLPYTAVWRPDILLYNCADEKFDRTFPTNTVMKYNGEVQWMPPGLFKSTCNIDISWFPFDEQNCILKFGSWTYNGDQIDFRLLCIDSTQPNCTEYGSVDLSEYSPNGEFHLMSASVRRFAQRYECCDYDFIDIKLYIRLQRRALYYVFNLIVPCLLISGMSLMVFMLPPDAGEKISLGVTILLSLTMFLQLVADKLPQTSEAIPLISIYFCCTMIMCSLSIVFTVLVLNYHHRSADGGGVPNWIGTVVNTYLAHLMFMQPPARAEVLVEVDSESASSDSQLVRHDMLSEDETNPLSGRGVYSTDVVYDNESKIGWNITNLKTGTPVKKLQYSNEKLACNRTNGVVGTYSSSEIKQDKLFLRGRSSKSLLANVLDLEDDFRAVAISPISQPLTAPMRKPRTSPHTNMSGIAQNLPPPYSPRYSGNIHPSIRLLRSYERSDVLSPDNLSQLSTDDILNSSRTESEPKSPVPPLTTSTYRLALENIVTELRFITSKLRNDEQEALAKLQWKFAARVIDRFCLIVFGIFNVMAAAAILLSAPNLVISFRP